MLEKHVLQVALAAAGGEQLLKVVGAMINGAVGMATKRIYLMFFMACLVRQLSTPVRNCSSELAQENF